MSPGTYIRLRRETARWTLADVALLFDTEPHVPTHARIDWLAGIEADRAPISERTALALAELLPVDLVTLSRLIAIAAGAVDVEAPRVCDSCGAPATAPSAARSVPLDDLPENVLSISTAAMMRHCGQPQTSRGIVRTMRFAREHGWIWGDDGRWRRPPLIAEPLA